MCFCVYVCAYMCMRSCIWLPRVICIFLTNWLEYYQCFDFLLIFMWSWRSKGAILLITGVFPFIIRFAFKCLFRTTEILALGDLKESCCSKWILKIVCGGVRKMSTKTVQIISKEYYYFYGLDTHIETIFLYKYNYSTNYPVYYPYISNYKNLI